MSRSFIIPSVNEITGSYGSSPDKPIILGTPGILSIKKVTPYNVIVEKNG